MWLWGSRSRACRKTLRELDHRRHERRSSHKQMRARSLKWPLISYAPDTRDIPDNHGCLLEHQHNLHKRFPWKLPHWAQGRDGEVKRMDADNATITQSLPSPRWRKIQHTYIFVKNREINCRKCILQALRVYFSKWSSRFVNCYQFLFR